MTIMSKAPRESIRDFILQNFLFTEDTSAIGFDDSLIGRGIVDSTSILEIICFIEEHFGVSVRDDEMLPENFDSVSNISRFVESKRSAA